MNTPSNDKRTRHGPTSPTLHNRNYYFEPIHRDSPTNLPAMQAGHTHSVERPTPIGGKPPAKRNSTLNISTMEIDSTVRSFTLPRSVTSDQLAKSTTSNRLYYYPSVQDVLDALNRRAFDEESFV